MKIGNIADLDELNKNLAENALCCAVELINNYEERRIIASKMKQIVDGEGANRIVRHISELCPKRKD